MPIIIYGCIYGGLCTVTEAGAVSCVYGILYFFVLKIIDKKKIKLPSGAAVPLPAPPLP